jgi:hypothetical protein
VGGEPGYRAVIERILPIIRVLLEDAKAEVSLLYFNS